MNEHVINLPEKGEFKFVQLYIRGEPYLICSKDHHYEILGKILEQFSFNFEKIKVPAGWLVPPLKNKNGDYEAVGMGKVTFEEKVLHVYGFSYDYRIGPDKEHLEKIKPYLPTGIETEILEF